MKSAPAQKRFILLAQISALLAATTTPALAITADWNVDINESWALGANWAGGIVPNAADDIANFTNNISAARTVTLDGTRTIGTLKIGDLDNTAGFTFTTVPTGGGLVFDVTAGNALLEFSSGGNIANTITAPIQLNDNLRIAITSVSSGLQSLNGAISGNQSITVDANSQTAANGLGDVTFNGVNTFTGGLTATQVRVRAGNTRAFGTGLLTVNNTGQFFVATPGVYQNNMLLTGLGWQETTGLLGALRSDGSSTFNGNIAVLQSGAATTTRFNTHTATSATNVINGIVGGDANVEFTKSNALGTSTWVLANDAIYTGTTTIGFNAGGTGTSVLQLGNGGTTGSLAAGSAVTINSGAVLAFNRSNQMTFTNTVSGAGGVTVNGSGTVIWDNGTSGYTGNTTVSGTNGRLVFGSGGAYTFSGATAAIALSNGGDIEFNTTTDINLSGALTGVANSHLILSAGNTITLSGAADNGGARTIVNSGTLVLGKASSGTVHAIGGGSDLGVTINGGTVRLGGTGSDQIVDGAWIRMNGGTFDMNGLNESLGGLTGNAGVITNNLAGSATLTIGGSNTSTITSGGVVYSAIFGGAIQNGVGTMGLIKTGTGLNTLSGTNTYSGQTTILGGVLSITGSLPSSGAVAVNNSATLSGTGTVGNVTLNAGGAIRPGATNTDNSAGTLNISSLSAFGGDFRFNLGATSDKLVSTGAVNFATATNLAVTFSALPVTTQLITGSSVSGTIPTLAVPATTRSTFALSNTGTALELTVGGPAAQSLTWSGTTNGNWDLNTTANFNAGAEKFFNLDGVTFGDGPTNRTITLAANLTPSSVTVNNSTGIDYTFQTGSLTGGMGITKSGNGVLILNTANSFSGDVTISAGTVRAGNATALGDANGATRASGGGTLDINGQNFGAEQLFISGTGVGGNGALINNGGAQQNATRFITLTGNATFGGSGRFDIRANGGGETLDLAGFTLRKTGTNHFAIVGAIVTDGNIIVDQGTLSLETTSTFNGAGSLTLNAAGTLGFYQSVATNITRPMTWNGGTVTSFDQNGGLGSNVTLGGDVTLTGTGGTYTFTGSMLESGGARAITKTGGATHVLAGNVVYTGATSVTGGTLQIGNGQVMPAPNTSAITLNGGTLNYSLNGNLTLPAVTIGTNGGTLRWIGATQGSTMTLNNTVGSSTNTGALTITQGTIKAAAGANITVNNVTVGFSSLNSGNVGTLDIEPGATILTSFFRLGDNSGFSGFVNQTGGSVTVTGVDNTDGFADGPLRIGHWAGTGAAYTISGGSLSVPNGSLDVGTDGVSPVLEIKGDAVVSVKRLEVDGRGATGPIGGSLFLRDAATLSIGDGGTFRANNNDGNSSMNISGGTIAATASSTWNVPLNFENGTATLNTGANNVTMTGALVGNGAPTKTGTGTLSLTGAGNNFSGTLNVTQGELNVLGQINGSGTVVLGNGTTLTGAGNGTTTGTVGALVLNAGSVIRPGTNGADATVGTLTASSLNFNGANARFTLDPAVFTAGGTANDLIRVTGATTLNGGTITPIWNATPSIGTYTLITSAGITNTLLPTLDASAASRQVYTLAVIGNDLTLDVAGSVANLKWSGGLAGNVWDLNTTSNWRVFAANDEKFFAYDQVTFDNTGSANPNVTLSGLLLPGTTTVNSTANYVLGGTGAIAGGSLTKLGTGTLTLLTNNTYPGATTVTEGVLRVGTSGTVGSFGTGPVVNNAKIIIDRSDNISIPNPLSGAGSLVKSGLNVLTLTSANTYTGGTIISKGTLLITNATGAGSGDVYLGDADTGSENVAFLTTNNQSPTNTIAVSPDGTGTATVGTVGGTTGTTFSGLLAMGRATTLQGQDSNFTAFSNILTGIPGTLNITGGRRVALQNVGNDFIGDINISGSGTVFQASFGVDSPEVIPNTSSVTVGTGTTFQLGFTADGTETINALNGAGTVQLVNATGGIHTLAMGSAGGSGTFTGTVQNGAVAPFYLTKLGAGTQTLSGAVNSTGSVTINSGVLAFGAAFGGGSTKAALTTDTVLDNTITVAAGVVTSDLVVGMSVSGTGIPAGSRITSIPSTTTITIAGTQSATLGGNLTFGAAPLIMRGGTFRYLGAARTDDRLVDVGTVGATLDASGTGALVLSAANLIYNSTGARTLTLTGTNTAVNALAAVITDSDISSPTSIVKNGPGTWSLTGAGSTYTGGVTVTEGVLRLSTNNKALGDGFAVSVSGSGTIDVNGANGGGATRRYDVTLNGVGAPNMAALWNSGGGVVNNPIFRKITLAGDSTIGGTQRYDINGGNVDGTGVTFDGGINSLIKVGTNEVWWAPNAGATVGNIIINAGRFGVQANNNLGDTSYQIIINPGGQLSTYAATTNAKAITLNGGQLHNNSAGAGTIGAAGTWTGQVTLAATPNTINTDNGTTVGGVIALNGKVTGPGGFEKIGAGYSLNLAAFDNDWMGDTKVTAGIIRTTATGALSPNTTLDMNGGTVDLNLTSQSVAGLKGATGTISGDGSLTVNQTTNTTYGGGITGATTLTKQGSGQLILTGNVSTIGQIAATTGTLTVNGSISGTVEVNGGTISGIGTIGTLNLNTGGTLAPGQSPGILTVGTANLLGGTFSVELNGTTVGTQYDQLKVTTGFSLTAPTELVINLGYTITGVDTFVLVNNTSLTPSTITDLFTIGGVPITDGMDFFLGPAAYQLDYNGGTDGNDIILTAVPEPGSALMLLGGLALCAASRRKRRNS